MEGYDASVLQYWEPKEFDCILAPRILPRPGIMVLTGDDNVGKSFLCLKLCSDLVHGNPPLSIFAPNKRRVMYVSTEMTGDPLKERVKFTTFSLDSPKPLQWGQFSIYDTPIDLTDQNSWGSLLAKIRTEKPELLIIDSVNAAGYNENAPQSAKQVITALRILSTTADLAIIGIWHLKKHLSQRTGEPISPVTDHIAGPKELAYEVDAILLVENLEAQVQLGRGRIPKRHLSFLKTRYSPLAIREPFQLDFDIPNKAIFSVSQRLLDLIKLLWDKRGIELDRFSPEMTLALNEARVRGLFDIGLLRQSEERVELVTGKLPA